MSIRDRIELSFLEKQKDFLGEYRMILSRYHDYMFTHNHKFSKDDAEVVEDLENIYITVQEELNELEERYGPEVDDE